MIGCYIMFAEAKEKVKDVASKGIESAKESASKAAEKGRGKRFLTRLISIPLVEIVCVCCCIADVKESVKDTASEAKEYVKDTGSSMAEKGRGKCNGF
jgi:hypothetical protein